MKQMKLDHYYGKQKNAFDSGTNHKRLRPNISKLTSEVDLNKYAHTLPDNSRQIECENEDLETSHNAGAPETEVLDQRDMANSNMDIEPISTSALRTTATENVHTLPDDMRQSNIGDHNSSLLPCAGVENADLLEQGEKVNSSVVLGFSAPSTSRAAVMESSHTLPVAIIQSNSGDPNSSLLPCAGLQNSDLLEPGEKVNSNVVLELSAPSTSRGAVVECALNLPDDDDIPIDDNESDEDLFISVNAELHEMDHMEEDSSLNMTVNNFESTLECDVSPNIVKNIKKVTGRTTNRKRTAVRRPTKSEITEGSLFILHTINHYEKYVKPSDAFNRILKHESLDLLSKWVLESDEDKKILSYMYCVGKDGVTDTDITTQTERITTLYEKGYLIFNPPDADQFTSKMCIHLLTKLQINEACDKFKKIVKINKKRSCKESLLTYATTRSITEFTNNTNCSQKLEVHKYLISKVKKWKLSILAQETITELIILMHLDNIFKMGCTIHLTNLYDDRPEITFNVLRNTTKYSTDNYPVDKMMIFDNASIIFRNREEFCAYLQALAIKKRYKMKGATVNKCEVVLRSYELYQTTRDENLSHYRALPPWLRRFTPQDVYLEILDDGLKNLKTKINIDKSREMLDLLITQNAYKQCKKAVWYHAKCKIQQKQSLKEAMCTLYESFGADLPEDSVNDLRCLAKEILDIKTRNQIDKEILKALKTNAKKAISIKNIDADADYFCGGIKTESKSKPKYAWKEEWVSAETLCCHLYKEKEQATLAENWEGHLFRKVYFLLFWDIIYTKPLCVPGIFMSHYQKYPLDFYCDSFYINRKAIIDDFLTKLEKKTTDEIVEMIINRYDIASRYDIPEITRKANNLNLENITTVVRCLGARALAVICRRLVQNYQFTRSGFPDLTLCNINDNSIKFREVKTDGDDVRSNQIKWLEYLQRHDINTSLCYLK